MTRPLRPTPYQTTLGDLASSLNEIYRTAGYRAPLYGPEDADYRCVNGHDRCSQMYAGPDCPYCEQVTCDLPGLEGNTPVEDDEPLTDPLLVNDTTKAIEAGDYDEFEPEDE